MTGIASAVFIFTFAAASCEIHEHATSLRLYVGTCCVATQYVEDDGNTVGGCDERRVVGLMSLLVRGTG